jgi:hypothetical protein
VSRPPRHRRTSTPADRGSISGTKTRISAKTIIAVAESLPEDDKIGDLLVRCCRQIATYHPRIFARMVARVLAEQAADEKLASANAERAGSYG